MGTIRYAAIRPDLILSLFGRVSLDLLGVDYRYVPGYRGGAKVRVAVLSKEADIAVHGAGTRKRGTQVAVPGELD